MGKLFENSILTTAGFQFQSDKPLDDRFCVETVDDLTTLIAYEGLWAYVQALKEYYYYTDGSWMRFDDKLAAILTQAKNYTTWEDLL